MTIEILSFKDTTGLSHVSNSCDDPILFSCIIHHWNGSVIFDTVLSNAIMRFNGNCDMMIGRRRSL